MSPMDVPHLKSEYRGSASSTAFHRRANSSRLEVEALHVRTRPPGLRTCYLNEMIQRNILYNMSRNTAIHWEWDFENVRKILSFKAVFAILICHIGHTIN